MNRRETAEASRLENIISVIAWLLLLVSLLIVLMSMLTLNGVLVTERFNDYLPLSISIFVTLTIWGLKFYRSSRRYPSYLRYSFFALLFALIQLIFILSNVY